MNKAFVREPDEPDDVRCPACQAIGEPVSESTLRAQLPSEAVPEVSNSAFFCHNPRCDVGYFDAFGRSVPAKLIRQLIYPKREQSPICVCTGMRAAQIIADAHRKNPARVREIIARCRANPSGCAERAPNERTCEAQVQKLYIRALQGGA